MNKIYRVIWNNSLMTFVAAGEYSRSTTGKSTVSRSGIPTLSRLIFSAMLLLPWLPLSVQAEGYSAGTNASAGSNDNAVAVGNTATVTEGQAGTAIGGGASANSEGSDGAGTAVGTQASVTGANLLFNVTRTDGQGYNTAGTYSGTALGSNAVSMGAGTALGAGSTADDGATAVGIGSTANAQGAVALGAASYAIAPEAISIGRSSLASGNNSVAMGNVSTASGEGSIALGNSSSATGPRAIALGSSSVESGGQDTATNTSATGADAIALGTSASASQTNGIAIGTSAQSTTDDGTAIGAGSSATGNFSVALGGNAVAGTEYGVALGYGSTTSNIHTGTYTIDGGGTAAGNARGVVSVGTAGTERQIQNVAPGVLSADSTDAINGSQLFATNTQVQAITNSVTSTTTNLNNIANALGGGAAIGADGSWTAPSYTVQSNAYNNVGDALSALDNATTSNSTAITNLQDEISNGGGSGLVQQDSASRNITVAAQTDGDVVDFTNANGATRRLTGVSDGAVSADSSDAVNGSQLFATNSQVEANTDDIASNSADIATNTNDIATNNVNIATNTNNIAANTADIATNTTNLDNVADALGGGAAISASGSWTPPSYTVQNDTYDNVGDALGALDTAATNNSTAITSLQDQVNNGGIGLVQQDSTSRNITVAAQTDGDAVDFTNANGATRRLTGVSDGAVSADSSDAVNGSQLFATNSQVEANTGDIAANSADIATNTNNISTNTANIAANTDDIATNSADIATNTDDIATNSINIATNTNNIAANTADIATNTTNLDNVADALGGGAAISAGGSWTAPSYTVQNGTYDNIGDALGALDTAATNNSTAITNLQDQVNNGGIGLVQQDSASRNITVAAQTDGDAVDFTNVNGATRRLTGVSDGTISADSSDAVNGSQLFATNNQVETNTADIATNTGNITANTANITTNSNNLNNVADALGGGAAIATDGSWSAPSYTVQNGTYDNVGDALGALDTATTSNSTAITSLQDQVNNGGIGLVQQDSASRNITVAAQTDGDAVDFTNVNGATRRLTGVSDGAVSADSSDAVNGSQLFATNNQVETNTADIATNTGNIIANTANITTNSNNLNNVADALGGGAAIATDGSWSAPSYTVQNGTYDNVGDALGALDTATTSNSTAITNLQDQVNNGGIGLVQQDSASRNITVAAQTDGDAVDFTNVNGATRRLTGVSDGTVSTDSSDAVNGSQLFATNNTLSAAMGGGSSLDDSGNITAPTYTVQGNTFNNVGDALASLDNSVTTLQEEIDQGGDESDLISQDGDNSEVDIGHNSGGKEIDVAGTDGSRVISGVADGVNDDDAATIAQLNELSEEMGAANKYLAVNPDENAQPASATGQNSIALGGNAKSSGDNGTAIGNNASASGTGASALGSGAIASGENALALGAASQASHSNSVALGANSVTDRANSVSVGSAGSERQITNVAAGTADTDAVNLGQLKGLQEQTNSSFRYLDKRINRVEDKLTAGIASSMAMAGIPQAYLPNSSLVGAAVSGYSDKSAVAVGVSRISDNGKWITKLQASANTESDFGASVGVGYQW